MLVHGLGNLEEPSNVAASDQAGQLAFASLDVLLGGLEAELEGVLHNVLQLLIDLLLGPGQALAVLGHLKTRDSDTTAVGSLARRVPDGIALLLAALVLEDLNGLESAAHVGALGDELAAVGNKSLGLLLADLVLGGARQSNVDLADVDPRANALNVPEVVLVLVLRERPAPLLELHDGLNILDGDALVVDGNQGTLRVGERDDGGTELNGLESGVLGDVARAGDGDALALPSASASVLEHVGDVVNETIAGGLGANQGTTPVKTLTGEDTLEPVAVVAVGAKEVADFPAANADVAGGDISVGTDVAGEFAHEGNAEATDFVVALTLGIEVGTTLATAHHEAGEGVLEDLLETEELQTVCRCVSTPDLLLPVSLGSGRFLHREVDRGVQTQTTLVRAKGRVELHAVAAVDLDIAVVVLPDNTELDDTLRDRDDLESGAILGVLLEQGAVLEAQGELCCQGSLISTQSHTMTSS